MWFRYFWNSCYLFVWWQDVKGDLFVHFIWNCVLLFAFENENTHFLNRRSFHFRWFFHFPINDKFLIHKFAVALCCRENILNNVIQFRQKIWITFATSSLSTRLGNLSFSVAKKHKMVAWSLQNHDLRRKNSIWKVLILSPLTTVFASRLQRVT